MKIKKYMVYLDDGKDCYKLAIPAKDEKAAHEYVQDNGEVIAVKEVTNDYSISADKVAQALQNAGFSKYEMDFITRSLREINICE